MACNSNLPVGVSLEQRQKQIDAALRKLELALTQGRVKVTIGRNGAMAFQGWSASDRDGVADVCAYRSLSAQSSPALRMAVARAEAMGGVRVNPQAVGAGVHSHDGGKSWHGGH